MTVLEAWRGVVLESEEEGVEALDMERVGKEAGGAGEQVVVKLVEKEGGREWTVGGLKRDGWKEGQEENEREGWPVL